MNTCRTTDIQLNQEESGHGDKMLPLATYHCIIPTAQLPNVPPHWHAEFEISLITDGSANYKFGAEDYITHTNDIIIIAPNTLHSIVPFDGNTQTSDTVVFHLDLVGLSTPDCCTIKYLQPLLSGEYNIINHISTEFMGYDSIRECFDNLYLIITQKPLYYEIELKENLMKLFRLLYVNHLIVPSGKINSHISKNKLIADILHYIDENYRNDLSIHSIATKFCLSDVHFMNYFHQASGTTCNKYITETRLRQAGHLLLETGLTISEICFECGFRNISNFNRRFLEYYSVTPSEYRKRFKGSKNIIQ